MLVTLIFTAIFLLSDFEITPHRQGGGGQMAGGGALPPGRCAGRQLRRDYSSRLLRARAGFGLLLPSRLSATAARRRSFKAVSLTFSPSWMSMARRTFPSRLELNRPEGSGNAAPLANVILTTFLYVSPVQTMP